jgi:hypothetical protein
MLDRRPNALLDTAMIADLNRIDKVEPALANLAHALHGIYHTLQRVIRRFRSSLLASLKAFERTSQTFLIQSGALCSLPVTVLNSKKLARRLRNKY